MIEHSQHHQRLVAFGLFLLALAATSTAIAYGSQIGYLEEYILLNDAECEGCYMMAAVFVVMSLFCLNAAWQQKASI